MKHIFTMEHQMQSFKHKPVLKLASALIACAVLTACSTMGAPKTNTLKACPEQRSSACTREFKPVCGFGETGKKIQSYGNACNACSDEKVLGYTAGQCK
jgi:hypothetical protein